MWLRNIIGALLLMGTSGIAMAQQYQRAVVYYYDWDVQTRSNLTIADVRQRFYTKIDIVDAQEATAFAKLITSKRYEKSPATQGIDVRLVIDLLSPDGKATTYFASQFRLYSNDGAMSVAIDDVFKNKFRMAD